MLSAISFCQTVILFYLFGYILFPRYLYRFRFVPFSVLTLLVYYLVYLSNYLTAYALQGISEDTRQELFLYTKQGWALAAFLSAESSFFYLSIILAGKLLKDLLTHRTRTLLLERDAVDLERSNLALERDNLMLELNLLKSQVNPHFLFNALNSIYARVVDANEPAAELVLHLAELMRYNLYEANVEKIALTDEIVYIENYLGLERMRHASLVDVVFSAHDDFSGYTIAPLILIAFVENAFKHGLGSGLQPAYVLVDIQLEATTFFFTVQNSIPPAKQLATGKKSGGVGLPNITKRLALLYPGRHTLEMSQTATSYTVNLQLQLEPQR